MPLHTNFQRFKEPRGFIKILQFFIAIFAFATTAGYYSEFKISVKHSCIIKNVTQNATHNELIKFSYPFKDVEYYFDPDECTKQSHVQHRLGHNYKSESQFFVFVGVVSFLYCIVAMVYYVSFEDPVKYGPDGAGRVIQSFATADLLVTMVLALFWFAGSIAWAVGLTSLKNNTDADKYIKGVDECNVKGASCEVLSKAGYAALTISVLFGFLSCFLWCTNIWFVYKETVWHTEPGANTSTQQPPDEVPHQQVPKGEGVP